MVVVVVVVAEEAGPCKRLCHLPLSLSPFLFLSLCLSSVAIARFGGLTSASFDVNGDGSGGDEAPPSDLRRLNSPLLPFASDNDDDDWDMEAARLSIGRYWLTSSGSLKTTALVPLPPLNETLALIHYYAMRLSFFSLHPSYSSAKKRSGVRPPKKRK